MGLTRQELEVLRLLAEGLVLSVVTVNSSLRSISTTLGVSSRTAASRFAI